MSAICNICASFEAEKLSPGPTIYEGQHWVLEHAYPCTLEGWTVAVLKQHRESLAETEPWEMAELSDILRLLPKAQQQALGCERSYVVSFGEKPGFTHLHFHIIPRYAGIPPAERGTNIFTHIRVDEEQALSPERIVSVCERLKACYESLRTGE